MLVTYMWLLKLYYLMLLRPLNIIVLLFTIIMTVEISYNLGLIEFSFVDIATIKTHQNICATMLTLLVLCTLPCYNAVVSVTSLIKLHLVTITSKYIQHVTIHTIEMLT